MENSKFISSERNKEPGIVVIPPVTKDEIESEGRDYGFINYNPDGSDYFDAYASQSFIDGAKWMLNRLINQQYV